MHPEMHSVLDGHADARGPDGFNNSSLKEEQTL
jgi:hypothetical protein